LSVETISQNKVYDDTFNYTENPMEHIELAKWADVFVIIPATANIIGKIANGVADDLLTNAVLASDKNVTLVPAMNMYMWQNPAVQNNIQKLKSYGHHILGPAAGVQACGDDGPGRMVEPSEALEYIVSKLYEDARYQNLRICITAGPTIEKIDPVRYISNHSSGKMGYALAKAFARLGCEVNLVSGKTCLPAPAGIKTYQSNSADEMYQQVQLLRGEMDIFISAAAVSDYKVAEYSDKKIKKNSNEMEINLTKNVDILSSVSLSENRPFCVGFAAETDDVQSNAQKKLEKKQLEMLFLNQVDTESGFPFYADKNQIWVFQQGHTPQQLPVNTKEALADEMRDLVLSLYCEKNKS
ncbi:bifunctional phosphopantothenoylcysteine decarboxylase/phosphopantothenate--cysteine ligase CoaBC, partial [Francisellaceae bacterium]|nr:bifunctional phosphopantothenoylcysteine decarboxylase/phosphopantothenate--cysteine ligase CoaBC [Francisellaceae bacterium]